MVYVYFCVLVVVVIAALVGAFYAWNRRQMPGAQPLTGLMIALAGWVLCDIFGAVSPNEDVAFVFESQIRFAWISLIYVLIVLLALDFVGEQVWLRPRRIALLSVIPVLTQLVIWFGPSDAFVSDVVYTHLHGFYLPDSRTFGSWFSLHTFYGYALILIGLGILLVKALRSTYPYRGQALLLLTGLGLSVVVSVVRTLGSGITLRYDWIALSFAGADTIFTVALFRYGLLNVSPIARASIVEQMADLVIVLDDRNRIVDFNPTVARWFGWTPDTVIGQTLRAVGSVLPAEVLACLDAIADHKPGFQPEVWPELPIADRIYNLRISRLYQPTWREVGRLLVLHDITESKQIEREFVQNQTRLSSLLTALPDLVFRLNRAGDYLDIWGHDKIRSLDEPRENVIGKNMFDVLPDDVAHYVHSYMVRALDTGHLQTVEYRLPTVSGMLDFEARIVPAGADEVISIARDITERKRMERTLRQREEETRGFQQKLLVLHDGTMELAQLNDLDRLYHHATEFGRSKLGFERMGIFMMSDDDPDMLVGRYGVDPQGNIQSQHHVQFRASESTFGGTLLAEKKNVAVKEEGVLWDEMKPVGRGWHAAAALWDGDEAIGWLVADNLLSHDPLLPYQLELLAIYGRTLGFLVAKLRQRDALSESEARFRLLSEATFEGVLVHEGGTIIDVNPALAAMFGYNLDALIGMHIRDLAALEVRRTVLELSVSSGPEIYEATGLRKDGTTFPAEVHARPFISSGRMLRVAAIRDLTQRKQAEHNALMVAIERERVHLLANFITNATHEFRTPLSVIKTRTHLLEQVADPTKQSAYVTTIREQADAMSRLVDDLVKMSQLDAGPELALTALDVNDLVQMLYRRMARLFEKEHLTVELDLQPDLPPVMGNIARLSIAFTKLLENALHYTPAGGTVMLRTESVNGLVMVEFCDTGIGIAAEHLGHVFERFYRVDEAHSTRGFGLGLSIAQRIVELHGGWIKVESVVGEGSVFRVALPAVP